MLRIGQAAVALVVAGGLVLAGWWAGRTALEPPGDPLATPAPVSVEVSTGTVGRSLPLSAIASWSTVGVVRAPVGGVVTSVDIDPGVPVEEGVRLATVNLVPTFAAIGTVPVFRDLGPGARGADVAQLQGFLLRTGHDPGTQDGIFASATTRAVRAWQAAVGSPVTGTVSLGSLVFVPALPARARPSVAVGDTVGPGEPLLEVVGAAPGFEIGLTEEQVSLIPPDAVVRLTGPEGEWRAQVGAVERVDGEPVLQLDGGDGAAVCGDGCDAVPLIGASSWAASVVVVPEVTGSLVPVGAIRTDPDGSRFVVTEAGQRIPVEVLGSADGQAVVDGVDPGVRVALPGDPP